jgi:signal transduction histidine kinase/integral membrane sensor domain MASE1
MAGRDLADGTPTAEPARRPARTLLLLLVVGATYYLGARLGFVLRFPPATTSIIWPPNALLTAALLLTPPRRWWLYLLAGALPAHFFVELQAGFPLSLVVPLFFSNSLEAVVAAWAIHRWSDAPERFDSLHRVLAFVAGAVFLAPLLSTVPDAAAVHIVRGEPFGLVCLRRMFSNSLSQLTLVPSAVVVVRHGLDWLKASTQRRRLEASLLALALVVVGELVFSGYQRESAFLPGGPYTALPFLMPLLLLAAVRYGPAGASLSLLATALLAIGSAMSGGAPLPALPVEEQVTALQVFLIVVGLPLLVLSALIEERRHTAETLRERLRFEELLSQISGAFVHLPSHQMGHVLETWLGRVGKFLGVDRVVLLRLGPDAQALLPYAWWAGPHGGAPLPRFERRDWEWSFQRLLQQEPVVSSGAGDLPAAAAAENERLRQVGVLSRLALPLVAGEQVVGALSLVTTTACKAWPEALIRNCRLLADVFAGVLARKLAEDALRANEAMQSAVLASLTSHVAVLDREGRIIAVNEGWTRFALAGSAPARPAAGVGASYLEACRRASENGDEEAREAEAGIRGVLDGSRLRFSQEYRCAAAAGERWFHMMAVPLERPEGGAVVSHTEVTERRLAEREAQTSRQELAHFLRVSTIGELTTSIAHELNQPLAAILANAQAARKLLAAPASDETGREVREIVSDIIEDDRRAGEVIRRLRELLRKGEGTRDDLDVNALVRDVIKLLGNDAMIRGVALRLELAAGTLVVRGDRVQLQQVLLNLIVNALEALAETEGDWRIGVRTERVPGSMARVSVEDSGPGLPAAVQREIFKPFFTTKAKGMGMGLSIARSILNAHGGTISADSAPERGARFTFTLPLVGARPPADARV